MQKAESENSVCMWFKKCGLINDYVVNKSGVYVELKDGTIAKGQFGSNQHRQYLITSEEKRISLDLKKFKIIHLS